MTALLQLKEVTAGYSSDIDIIRDVSIRVEKESVRGLIGLNGAGKSTVMKAACGFLKPKCGQIIYDGKEITGIETHRLLGLGITMIPQESSLFPYLSVADNLKIPLQRYKNATKESIDISQTIESVIKHFPEIKAKMGTPAGELSGGQQKMVEFAKAYTLRPRLCLIDEPSIGLAPKVAAQVFEWIKRFAREGMAILLVDHNIRKVIEVSDYTYVLTLGEVTAEGLRKEFTGDMHDQVRSWLGLDF
ncbi:MAG: ATP-binding cassette domain-containing protein [Desulfobacterales bacterium]|jgi:ABC-type branched-subunit amino acid transport system ATPase component